MFLADKALVDISLATYENLWGIRSRETHQINLSFCQLESLSYCAVESQSLIESPPFETSQLFLNHPTLSLRYGYNSENLRIHFRLLREPCLGW